MENGASLSLKNGLSIAMTIDWIAAMSFFAAGIFLQLALRKFIRYRRIQQIRMEAEELILKAKDKFERAMDQARAAAKDYERNLYDENAALFDELEGKVSLIKERLEAQRSELQSEYDLRKNSYQKLKKKIDQKEKASQNIHSQMREKQNEKRQVEQKWIKALCEKYNISREDVLKDWSQKLEKEAKKKAASYLEEREQWTQLHLERDAKRIIHIALNRFKRLYCPERGIGFIVMKNEHAANKLLGPDKKNLTLVEELCGVDILHVEASNTLSVSGFDPVRRELGRLVLNKLSKQKDINEKVIRSTYERAKQNLFKKNS